MSSDETILETLKDRLRTFAALFGEPASLWAEQVVPRRQGLLIRAWLRALETIARALLLTAAAALPESALASRPAAVRATRARANTAPAENDPPTDEGPSSETWAGVAFRVLPCAAVARAKPETRPPARFLRAAPLAFRFEALIRVAEAPGRYARRLARRLRAAPDLARHVLRPPPPWDGRAVAPDEVGAALDAAAAALGVLAPDTG
jgi:hypothetical protein